MLIVMKVVNLKILPLPSLISNVILYFFAGIVMSYLILSWSYLEEKLSYEEEQFAWSEKENVKIRFILYNMLIDLSYGKFYTYLGYVLFFSFSKENLAPRSTCTGRNQTLNFLIVVVRIYHHATRLVASMRSFCSCLHFLQICIHWYKNNQFWLSFTCKWCLFKEKRPIEQVPTF